ncbi:1028_t:CDS:2 [Funneliformis caledonium]|uniref:1028_t:CDS:1 n=1 Tax=Funneliformis caledonium TaxID=1117310 RepID=A0A9N8YUG0_9GLOM|nr:1028_t:CDS:2 [Funneliformis caledonium]
MPVHVDGFKSSAIFEQLKVNITDNEAKKIRLSRRKEQVWTLDFKNDGTVNADKGTAKPDIIINLSDDTFVDLAKGKIKGK